MFGFTKGFKFTDGAGPSKPENHKVKSVPV